MIDFSKHKLAICLTLFCIIILMIAAIFNIRTYNSSKDIEKRLAYSIQAQQQNIDQLESRIKEFEELVKETQASLQSFILAKSESNKGAPQSEINNKQVKTAKDQDQQNLVTATADMDQEVLREIYDEAIREKNIRSQRSILRDINLEQREIDRELYDETVEELFLQALPENFGNKLSAEEREKALNELLEKYPDSYAAAKAVSLEAISSVRMNEIEKVEEYYNLLIDLQSTKTESVILDNGLEAVPSVSYPVAISYHRNGMTGKIAPILINLEENYSDSLMRIRTPGGPRQMTGVEAANILRRITGVD